MVTVDVAAEIAVEIAEAVNDAATLGNAGSDTWNVWLPAEEPRIASTSARPEVPVVIVVSAGLPPGGARNRTATPPTGRLSAARTSTSSGVASA